MRPVSLLIAMLAFATPIGVIPAQETSRLPSIAQRQINGETIVVARLNLSHPGIQQVSDFFANYPDPSGWFGLKSDDFRNIFRNLQTARKGAPQRVTELFLLISTHDLPTNSLTLAIPVAGTDADRAAVAEALKTIRQGTVETVENGIIFSTDKFRPYRHQAVRSLRPELTAALAAIKQSPIQIAVGLDPDTRRVIREFWPELPAEFGGGSGLTLADGWKWLALGLTPSPRPEAQFILQTNDVPAAEASAKMLAALLKLAISAGAVKEGSTAALIKRLTPTQQGDRLIIAINDANGGAQKVIDEFAEPLKTKLLRNTVLERTVHNLRLMILALHDYLYANKTFPPAANLSPDGKPLLSWRVHILPYVDEKALYKEFHLNEPWDSEHNRKLITRMPDIYASSSITTQQRARGITTYLGINGEHSLFSGLEHRTLKSITDGIANTIGIVDATTDHAVIWTQPVDLKFDTKNPHKGLAGQPEKMFQVGFCSGIARAIPDSITPENLRRLLLIDDGETVEPF
jgi:hypothetical protein